MTDDELLTPGPMPDDFQREAIFARGVKRLRWRRRVRFAMRGAFVAAVFAAGFAAASLRPETEPRMIVIREPVAPDAAPIAPPPPPPARKLSPPELELEAEKTFVKAESARLYREAGDAYLREFGDHRAALRCYRNFLDESLPADRAESPDDTWMLTSLKRAREQENNP